MNVTSAYRKLGMIGVCGLFDLKALYHDRPVNDVTSQTWEKVISAMWRDA